VRGPGRLQAGCRLGLGGDRGRLSRYSRRPPGAGSCRQGVRTWPT
jgi:hypothetical protein